MSCLCRVSMCACSLFVCVCVLSIHLTNYNPPHPVLWSETMGTRLGFHQSVQLPHPPLESSHAMQQEPVQHEHEWPLQKMMISLREIHSCINHWEETGRRGATQRKNAQQTSNQEHCSVPQSVKVIRFCLSYIGVNSAKVPWWLKTEILLTEQQVVCMASGTQDHSV